MSSTDTPPTVAVFNSNDDTVELLRVALEQSGLVVVSGHVHASRRGDFDILEFLAEHDPSVVLYDLAPPYDVSWNHLQHLRARGAFKGRELVLTTTNARRVEELLGVTDAFEIVGKPYDIQRLVEAVRDAAGLT